MKDGQPVTEYSVRNALCPVHCQGALQGRPEKEERSAGKPVCVRQSCLTASSAWLMRCSVRVKGGLESANGASKSAGNSGFPGGPPVPMLRLLVVESGAASS